MEEVRVAVDVMGGDEEPQVVLDGHRRGARRRRGAHRAWRWVPEELVVRRSPMSRPRVEALVAPDVIEMADDPHQGGDVQAEVLDRRGVPRGEEGHRRRASSPQGATGAITAAATAYVTPVQVRGGGRAAAAAPVPHLGRAEPYAGGLTVFCDLGANPDVEPGDMLRFAQMGAAYARVVCGIAKPRVGLLSNGTEDTKGSHFTKECFALMRDVLDGFAGNCEGSDIVSGSYDVVVADGFAGNVALKATEGAAKFILSELKGALLGSLKGKIAALLIKNDLAAIKEKLSGDAKGGAILLGLRGVVLIGHGATSVEAVKNGTLATAEAVRAGLIESIVEAVGTIAR